MSFRSFRDSVRRHVRFSRQEWLGFVVTVFVFAVIASFTLWGGTTFDAVEGLRNLALAIIITGTGVLVHHLAQKVVAVRYGLMAEIKMWWYGLFGGLLLAVVSNGAWQVYAATGVFVHHLPIARLGRFRYYPDLGDWAKVALAGPVANVILAGVVKTIQWWLAPFNDFFVEQFFTFNILFAALNLFPIPPLDGSRIFYASRLLYVFIFSTILSYAMMVVLLNVYSYVLALLVGVVATVAFYIMFEKTW